MENGSDLKKPKILMVDDDKTILDTWPKILTSNGFNVITAEDGKTALDLVAKEFPDVIVCDILIPKIDGIKFCELLRTNDNYVNIPVILCSGVFKDYEFRMKVIKSLADDFIEKPFNEFDLLVKINKSLSID